MGKQYEELGITDAFMFAKVMSNKEICKPVLEQILNIKIRDIEYLDYEETIQIAPGSKSIRLDIYVEDDKNTVFILEMQTTNYEELPKGSRYYQDIIDLKLIEKGQSYDILKTSYVIFICTFDFFEKNRSIYEFENICVDDSDIKLNDGTHKIFLNTKGNRDGISKELQMLLDYFDGREPESQLPHSLLTEKMQTGKCLKPETINSGGESICHIRWSWISSLGMVERKEWIILASYLSF